LLTSLPLVVPSHRGTPMGKELFYIGEFVDNPLSDIDQFHQQ